MGESQVRANWPKFVVRSAKHHHDASGAPIANVLSDDLRRRIREAGRLSWEDAQLLTGLAEEICLGCGPVAARAFWRASFLQSITQPMMAPLARGALMLWGKSPA